MSIQEISIIAAAAAVSFGAIGPALAEGRAVSGAMDAIARQPESASAISRTLFVGLPQPCEVGRYHSLIAAPDRMPPDLEVSARTAEGEIMGARHRTLAVEGVQFHPESILTPEGPRLLGNFLELRSSKGRAHAISA